MENPQKKQNPIKVLIPGYDILKYDERQIAETFMRWFVSCVKHQELLEICESAARSRFDKIAWLKTMRELFRLLPGDQKVLNSLKKMVKINKNSFLMITARMEEIVSYEKQKTEESPTSKVRIVISDDVKRALK